jgi:hypothetical protein
MEGTLLQAAAAPVVKNMVAKETCSRIVARTKKAFMVDDVSVGGLTSVVAKLRSVWGLFINRIHDSQQVKPDATKFINRNADASFIFDEQEVSFCSRN